MIGFIVSGHGRFASGMTAAIELIIGKQDNYAVVDFPDGDTKTEIEKNMHEALVSLNECEHIVVFCDLLSGSPFNTAIMEAMNSDKISVLYGTNLGMLMESIMKRNMGFSAEDIVAQAIDTGKECIGRFEYKEMDDDDDFN